MSMKNSNDTMGNRTHDLACMPQPTAPRRAPSHFMERHLKKGISSHTSGTSQLLRPGSATCFGETQYSQDRYEGARLRFAAVDVLLVLSVWTGNSGQSVNVVVAV
jgi:hypothetical protein